ncbi:MAG: precorrin-2 C(20)-methyltransferase [Desulfobacteraceae bacterium]|nr:MAG: precorrin-2 C(20)-methyltransferase [Desulfobacteraceae bacterium]
MQKKSGTFFGIGVGPGDPELITMKAIRILQKVDCVYAASSTKNSHSLAVDIARAYIPEGTPVERLRFPMTTDPNETQAAWMENAARIHETLSGGSDAAFLTLGDPMTYSTYGYVLRYLKRIDPEIVPVTVPGISSYQAAAARLNVPLAEGEEALLVVSGARGGDRLRELAVKPETIVFLKAYRNVADIRRAIEEAGSGYRSMAISNCGHTGETIVEDLKELENRSPDYWTLIIAKRKK